MTEHEFRRRLFSTQPCDGCPRPIPAGEMAFFVNGAQRVLRYHDKPACYEQRHQQKAAE